MSVLLTIVGAALILVALRDIVHELFHPEERGSLSSAVMALVWRITKWLARWFPRALVHAGPAVLIAVATVWAALLALGWALIYTPRVIAGFHTTSGLPVSATHGFFTALYVSLATMATVGASDVTPQLAGIRIVLTLEAIVGLVLITAWITWVLSIYPVLASRRAFARKVSFLQRAEPEPEGTVRATPPESLADILRVLAEEVVHIDAELRQSAVTYYFQQPSADATLPAQLPYVLALARIAEDEKPELVRYHGRLLREAVEALVDGLAARFLAMQSGSCDEKLDALARDHLRRGAARA